MATSDGTPSPVVFSFSDFLEKMKDPAAADLVRSIKGFIHHFEQRATTYKPNPEADSAAVQDFLRRMEAAFRAHQAWKGATSDVIEQAIEGLEKYIMSKVWPRTFAACAEDRDRDERYSRLAHALSFVDLSTLMGQDVIPDEALVTTAVGELLRMDRYKAPRDKLLCLVNVKTLVEDVVVAAARAGAAVGGADAFFPVFLLVVIRARLPRLASNIEYIRRFRARARLSGQSDYMLCNLESAAVYLDTVDWKHLKISQEEFLIRLAEAGIPEADMELRSLREAAAAATAAVEDAGNFQEPQVEDTSSLIDIVGTQDIQVLEAEAAVEHALESSRGALAEQLEHDELIPTDKAATISSFAGIKQDGPSLSEVATIADSELLNKSPRGDGVETTTEPQGPSKTATPSENITITTATAAATAAPQLSIEIPTTTSTTGQFSNDINAPEAASEQPNTLDGTSSSNPVPPPLSTTSTSTTPSSTGGGLTPLGAGPQTPVAIRQRPTSEQSMGSLVDSQLSEGGMLRGGVLSEVVAAMVADGTPLVLEEEAEGRLQQRHPWIYAAAEDLSVADVRSLLAAYRDLVLKYESLSLSLQRQVNAGGSNYSGQLTASSSSGQLLAAQSLSGGAGALFQKLTSWGRTASEKVLSNAPERDGTSGEAAAALRGKAAGGDTRLLHSLFGSPHQQPSGEERRSHDVVANELRPDAMSLIGDLGGSQLDRVSRGGLGRPGSPTLGLIEQQEVAPGESLI